MKIQDGSARKITITEVPHLDPVVVYLEEPAPGSGKVIITCYGQSWTYYWSSMGTDLISFLLECHIPYLISKFDSQLKHKVEDLDGIEEKAKERILELQAAEELTTQESDEFLEYFEFIEGIDDSNDFDQQIMSKVFGEYWYHDLPKKINYKYEYLEIIIKAVKEALEKVKDGK